MCAFCSMFIKHCADEPGSFCDSGLDEPQSSSIVSLAAGEYGIECFDYRGTPMSIHSLVVAMCMISVVSVFCI